MCGWNGETIVKWILSDKGDEELPERGRGMDGSMDGWRDGWLDRLPTSSVTSRKSLTQMLLKKRASPMLQLVKTSSIQNI